MRLAMFSISCISFPIDEAGRFSSSMFRTILIEPIGERRSCAMTEYSLSRPDIVRCSSSVCRMMIRLAAISEI